MLAIVYLVLRYECHKLTTTGAHPASLAVEKNVRSELENMGNAGSLANIEIGGKCRLRNIVCISSRRGGPALPCSWISFDDETKGACLKGTDPGPLAWPSRQSLDHPELVPF